MKPAPGIVRRVPAGCLGVVGLVALAVLAAGCVYYPTIVDLGGPRIQPANGRAVRHADGAVFTVELNSTGKYGDVLRAVSTPVARSVRLVSGDGAPLGSLTIPGTTLVRLSPGASHVVLGDLVRPLQSGEVIIVTLTFEKSGALGVVTVVE